MQTLIAPFLPACAALVLIMTGCVNVHHKIDPIEITLNVKLETVDKELDNFFSDLDAANTTLK